MDKSPMALSSFARWIALALLPAAFAGCTSTAVMEQQAGREFEQLRETAPLVKDRATIDYVACVANAIIDVLEPPDSDMYWELAIVDNPTVNAFVMPGGKIVVFTGLLEITQNQHQLAAVIGHEVAHVTENHPEERMRSQEVASFGVETAARVLGGGWARETYAAYGGLSTITQLGLLNPFSRGQESEADIVGLEFMAQAGFDPRESVELWKRMNAQNESRLPEYLSTHPSGETRIDDLIAHYPTALVDFNEAQQQGKDPRCGP